MLFNGDHQFNEEYFHETKISGGCIRLQQSLYFFSK